MSQLGQKRKRDTPMMDDDEDDYEGDYIDQEQEETIATEFEVNFPDFEWDTNGVELYLKQLLYGESFDTWTLTQIVMGNAEKKIPNPCTSVIKMPPVNVSQMTGEIAEWDWEEDVYGVGSIIHMNPPNHVEVFKQIQDFIATTCVDPNIKTPIMHALTSSPVGLLINSHVVNLPLELTAKYHENLLSDYQNAVKTQQIPFFKYIVIFSKAVFPSMTRHKKEPIFAMAEDIFFYRAATINYRFVLKHHLSHDGDDKAITLNDEGVREGVVMFIPTQAWQECVKKMNAFILGESPM